MDLLPEAQHLRPSPEHEAFSHFYLPRLRAWTEDATSTISEGPIDDDRIIRLLLDTKGMHDCDCFLLAEALSFNSTLRELSMIGNPAVSGFGVLAIARAAARHPQLAEWHVRGPIEESQPDDVESITDAFNWASDIPIPSLDFDPSLPPESTGAHRKRVAYMSQLRLYWERIVEIHEAVLTAIMQSKTLSIVTLPDLPQLSAAQETGVVLVPGEASNVPDWVPEDMQTDHTAFLSARRKAVTLRERIDDVCSLNAIAGLPFCWKEGIIAALSESKDYYTLHLSMEASQWRNATPSALREALRMLAKGLANCTSITRLVLDGYERTFGDEGALLVATFIGSNKALREISLRDNAISCAAARRLAAELDLCGNESLAELDLSGNNASDRCAEYFLEVVRKNRCQLGYVNLDRNCVSPDLLSRLHQAIMLNTQPAKFKQTIPQLDVNNATVSRVVFNQPASTQRLNDLSCRVLAQAMRRNTIVTHIDLSNNAIGDDGAVHLAHILVSCKQLRRMILQFNQITNHGALLLMEATPRNPSIELVDCKFQQQPIDENILTKLVWLSSLTRHPFELKVKGFGLVQNDVSITEVRFNQHQQGDRPLTNETVNLCLEILNVNCVVNSFALIGHPRKDFVDVAGNLPNILEHLAPRLTQLDLSDNALDDAAGEILLQTLKDPSRNGALRELHLDNNDFSDDFGSAVAGLLRAKNDVITTLTLEGNKRISKGTQRFLMQSCQLNRHDTVFKRKILDAFSNSVEMRELSFVQLAKTNELGTSHHFVKKYDDVSADLICTALEENTVVTKLNVSGHNIGDEGASRFAELLRTNTTLTSLDLSANDITDVGLMALGRALIQNQVVRVLIYSGNRRLKDLEVQKVVNIQLAANVAALLKSGGALDEEGGGSMPSVNTAAIYSSSLAGKRGKLLDAAADDRRLDEAIFADAMSDFHKQQRLQRKQQKAPGSSELQ